MQNKMLNDLENLYSLCFPNRKQKWTASDFAKIKKSGAEIIASQNAFAVYRCVADECEIILIGVAPDFRRTGTATALLTIVEKESKKQSVNKIFLEVSSTNIPAQKLYVSDSSTGLYTGKPCSSFPRGFPSKPIEREII